MAAATLPPARALIVPIFLAPLISHEGNEAGGNETPVGQALPPTRVICEAL